jgi:Fe-S-cluster containining protein
VRRLNHSLSEQAGFDYRFNPAACATCGGACCTGERGEIWIDAGEIEVLARFLGESVAVIKGCYLRRERAGYTIKERKRAGDYACWFFDDAAGRCRIYSVRPAQCRSFPFWPFLKEHVGALQAACPGVCV